MCCLQQWGLDILQKNNEFCIDDPGNGIMSTYFDNDLDGDLDLYVSSYPSWRCFLCCHSEI